MKRMINTGARKILEIGEVLLELVLHAKDQGIRKDLIQGVTQATEDNRMGNKEDNRMGNKVEKESIGEMAVVK